MTGGGYWPTWPARSLVAAAISDFRVIGAMRAVPSVVGSSPAGILDAIEDAHADRAEQLAGPSSR